MKRQIFFLLLLLIILLSGSTALGEIIVGRIAYVEGQIYRYMESNRSWTDTYRDSPAGTQDILATGEKSRAEIIFPGNIQLLLAENSEIEIINLGKDNYVFTLNSGLARFVNGSEANGLDVETAMGTAGVGPGSIVDIMINTNGVSVSAVLGASRFIS